MTRSTTATACVVAPLALLAWGAVANAATPIGTTAEAKNSVNGTVGGNKRDLSSGDSVFQNERIQTGANSRAQLLFKDETALTLNENSSIVLDKLIYDPGKKNNGMVLRAVSGSFRFISGSSPKKNYQIRTPVGTIGIRGTIIQVKIKEVPQGSGPPRTWVQLGVYEGGATLCNNGGSCVDLPAGTYAVVAQGGKPGQATKFGSGACGSSGSFSAMGGRSYCTVFDETGTPLQVFVPGTLPTLSPPTPNRPPLPNPPPS